VAALALEPWFESMAFLDPVADHRPDDVFCEDWFVEDTYVEVDTDTCSYFSVWQPLRHALGPGTRVVGSFFHDVLSAETVGSAHAAIYIGDELLWEANRPIPSDTYFEVIDVPIGKHVPRGTVVTLHLHNHGDNTYRFEPLVRFPGR
jgi:hypothetical protein